MAGGAVAVGLTEAVVAVLGIVLTPFAAYKWGKQQELKNAEKKAEAEAEVARINADSTHNQSEAALLTAQLAGNTGGVDMMLKAGGQYLDAMSTVRSLSEQLGKQQEEANARDLANGKIIQAQEGELNRLKGVLQEREAQLTDMQALRLQAQAMEQRLTSITTAALIVSNAMRRLQANPQDEQALQIVQETLLTITPMKQQ